MKARDLKVGDKIKHDKSPTGYVGITDITERAGQLWITLDNLMRTQVIRLPDDDVIMWEGTHSNTVDVLAEVYRELGDLLDGDVDAPNVWRWTAMRLRKRTAEVLPVHRLRAAGPEDPGSQGASA